MKKIFVIFLLLFSSAAMAEEKSVHAALELRCTNSRWVSPAFKASQHLYIYNNSIYVSVGVAKYIKTDGLYAPFSFNGRIYTLNKVQKEPGECQYVGESLKVTMTEGVNRFDINQDGIINYEDVSELLNKINEDK